MTKEDLNLAKRDKAAAENGFKSFSYFE